MKKLFFLSPLLGLLLLTGCGGASSSSPTDEQNPYVSAHTGGIVSIDAIIKVRLSQVFESAEDNQEIKQRLFKFTPSVEGDTYWIDANTIGFKPKKRLKSDTEYKVKFAVSELFPDAKGNNKTFSFSFTTLRPSFTRRIEGLKLYDDDVPGDYYLQGIVRPADYTENDKIEKLLQAEVNGKTVAVTWQHADNHHDFSIENLKSADESYTVLLKWNGKPIGFNYSETDTIIVPKKNSFQVLSTKVNTDNNSIECVFSYPLDNMQKYASYIQLGNIEKLRFTTSSNKLEIHLSQKPTGTIQLTIREGLKSKIGVPLAEDYTANLLFEELKPEVRLTGKGVVMPNSEGLILPFQAVNLSAVDITIHRTFENNVLQFLQVNNLNDNYELNRVAKPIVTKTIRLDENKSLDLHQWNTFSIDLASIINPEPGAIYTVKIEFSKEYSLYGQCEESGDYSSTSWRYRDDPCYEAYYSYNDTYVSQNILASDIGLVAKRGGDKNYLVFVTNLVTAQPMSGVKVTLYNYQQQKIAESTSDGNGVVQINYDDVPYVLVAQHGVQKSYLRLSDGLSLSLSTFDVSGARVERGLKGLIYGERGVWRPGDTLFLTFVLEDRSKTLPENHPVTFELYNVQSQLVSKQVRSEGQNGFYTFICPTDPDAPTGNWDAIVKVGGITFSKSLRVATIKPNRLKITTNLDHDPVLYGQNVSGTISAQWLHGAKLSGNEADIAVRLTPVRTTFKGYPDYAFDDITKSFQSEEEKERSGHLDANGMMKFDIPLQTNKQSAGKLRAAVAVRVFEDGGEFSTDNFSVEVSPYEYYVGLKMPKGIGYYNRLETGKDHTFEVVTLDASGKPVNRSLNVEVFRNEWNWWWFSSDGSFAEYSYRLYENRLYAAKIKTDANGKGSFTYKMDYPEWGLFLIKVTDPETGHSVTQKAYIDWWSYGRGSDDEDGGATILTFRSDKNKYNVGEKAVVTIPSAEGAKAIVTVENGSRVLASFRVDCKGTETQFTIPTTAEMTPNAYVFVTLLQPHQQTKNDLPMRLYGVIPLMVENPATRINPEISMTDVIRPEQAFKVKVKETNGKEMTYTLAIVDEGLLDLTRFKTPDLWEYFFQREALGVRTWDLYNFVLGAYGGKIEQMFAIGGDEEGEDKKGGEKANRFKPVVQFAGPFTVKSGKTNEHTFTISNYVGSVRAMVVAGNGFAYGKTEKTVPVRSPLMVQATLPRVLGPGEEVVLPATVFAMESQVKNVTVELKANDMFEAIDGASRKLTFTETGDELVKFNLRVKNKLGVGRVKVIATSGNERAENEIEIDIRASNPPVITTKDLIVQGRQAATLSVKLPGMEGTNTAELEVSSIPPLNLGTRLNYLLSYPHGCLEQTTSAVFPQLFLPDVVEMTKKEKDRAADNVKAALNRLTYFVKMDGSFSYWPGGTGYGCEWTNNYAGHFLIEAERKGYKIPGAMKDNWISYQQKAARNWNASYADDRYAYSQNDLIQAYRLYVLALAKKQELSAMNRLKERPNLSLQAKWMLAGAYALVGQPEAATSITNNLSLDIKPYSGFSDTYGSSERDDAIILDVLTLTGNKENAFLMAKRVSEAMNTDHWMSTQTTAYCLLGLSKYAAKEKGELNFAYTIGNNKTENVSSKKSLWNNDLDSQNGTTTTIKIDNKADNILFVRLTAKGIPMQGDEKATGNDLRLAVRYMGTDGSAIDVTRLSQGTDFEAEVKIINPGQRGRYSNMALTQIFPSGWEITENRLEDVQRNDGVTYRDIRDDRVLGYFDLSSGQTITVRVKLRAAYVGKFYLPAVACEAMYDATINANTTGQQVEVY